MRDTNGFGAKAAGTFGRAAVVGVIATFAIFHPLRAGLVMAALLGALLIPPALLSLLLRVVKFRDRHAHFRLVRRAPSQAFPPAAFGNSRGGRNVS